MSRKVKCTLCETTIQVQSCYIDDIGFLCKTHGQALHKDKDTYKRLREKKDASR